MQIRSRPLILTSYSKTALCKHLRNAVGTAKMIPLIPVIVGLINLYLVPEYGTPRLKYCMMPEMKIN